MATVKINLDVAVYQLFSEHYPADHKATMERLIHDTQSQTSEGRNRRSPEDATLARQARAKEGQGRNSCRVDSGESDCQRETPDRSNHSKNGALQSSP